MKYRRRYGADDNASIGCREAAAAYAHVCRMQDALSAAMARRAMSACPALRAGHLVNDNFRRMSVGCVLPYGRWHSPMPARRAKARHFDEGWRNGRRPGLRAAHFTSVISLRHTPGVLDGRA